MFMRDCRQATWFANYLFLLLIFGIVPAVQAQVKAKAVPASPLAEAKQQGFIVPFTPVSGQGAPLVQVWINGQVAATFIVDTGTLDCLISQSLVKKLGLKLFPALQPDGTPLLLEGIQPQSVSLTSLQIGGREGPLTIQPMGQPLCVLPDQQLRVSASQVVDGLIGSSLLSNFAVAFDFPKHNLVLVSPGGLTSQEAQSIGYDEDGGTALPLSSGDARSKYIYYAPIGLENNRLSRQVNLLVDTGAQTTTIPRRTALDLSLTPLGKMPQSYHSGSYSIVQFARPQALLLGDLKLSQPVLNYSDNPDYTTQLGLNILANYRVLMDFPAKKMYLQPAVPEIKIGIPAAKEPPVP